MSEKKIINFFIISFITLVIMNGISFEPVISNIGKYGKIFISVSGLIILFPIYYKGIKKVKFTLNWLLLTIGVLLVFFFCL